jgi:hypothetical protein
VAAGKVGAVAATGGITGLIVAFGAASTGTPIATLSGAALASATSFWIGSLFGLGAFGGTMILLVGGVLTAIITGRSVGKHVLGRERSEGQLRQYEHTIVAASTMLLNAINEAETDPTRQELRTVADEALVPLLGKIDAHLKGHWGETERFSHLALLPRRQLMLARNDLEAIIGKAGKLKKLWKPEQVQKPRKRGWLDKLRKTNKPTKRLASVVIAVTLHRLMGGTDLFQSVEEQLVIEAVRRSTRALEAASLDEIREYVAAMSPQQARGFLNNVKGIYHELVVANAENVDGDEIFARPHEETNHPGTDIEFLVYGEIVSAVQLKATDNAAYIQEHLDRYPEVCVMATEEIAAEFQTVRSSGFTNAALSESVGECVRESSSDIADGMASSASASILISTALHAGEMLRSGKISKAEVRETMKDVAAIGGTSAILDLLIGG